jgi:CubicO group peptidase (beta-lactamase class C family)
MLKGTVRRRRRLAAAVLAGAVLAGCAHPPIGGGGHGGGGGRHNRVPGDEWVVEAPADHGMDPAVLQGARDYAFADGMNTQGVVVVRDGVIVSEWYAEGSDRDSWTASWSMAKSFTSALVGIAIAEGKIPSVDEPMTTYYPEWAGTPRASMTLRDVLQMSSGLDWVEDYDPMALEESDIIQLVLFHPDQLAYAAARPALVEPGTRWSYSSGDTMLLSGVLEQATGVPVHEYAAAKLFDPLEMERAEWWRDAAGHTLTYCCLDTTSRGFARFGLLYLRNGKWGRDRVVPRPWVRDSLEGAPTAPDGYGYQWWLGDVPGVPADMFSARGHDGQYIYVIPSLDLVVVRNGTYVKDPGEPVADPNLFGKYPSDGIFPGRGTVGPPRWSDAEFLGPIVQAITDP